MSQAEELVPLGGADDVPAAAPKVSFLNRFLDLLCSVRLGIILLILLGLACFLGMVIMQQNVSGFDRYYGELTPAQQVVYGALGLFDIYHTWYFNALLLFLSLNIILSSIDRFPSAWSYIGRPKTDATTKWLQARTPTAEVTMKGSSDEVVGRIREALRSAGFSKTKVTEKNGRSVVFAEKGVWNRLGAYAVHVGLLTIFAGGFMTTQMGQTGQMPLTPGQTSKEISDTVFTLDRISEVQKQIPFSVTCTDIQQKLIKDDGPINAMNTIDWITKITINDEYGTHEATVQMNRPYDYRGYRFFQASFVPTGRARNITLNVTSANGGEIQQIQIPRNERVQLADGTVVRFVDFRGSFKIGQEDQNEDTSMYPNPAAVLQVTAPGDVPQTAYAFGEKLKDIPIAKKPVGGYTFQLASFEKVGDAHILSVQRDPGANVVYVGFVILCLTLVGVFFFAHQRIWVAVEPKGGDGFDIVAGGDTNRNQTAFEEKFIQFISALKGDSKEA